MMVTRFNETKAIEILNRILQSELAGVVRYTHYSLMVFGYNRIPIVRWLRQEASNCLSHAQQAGEMITHLGTHPSLEIGRLLETHRHDIGDILRESLTFEEEGVALYHELLHATKDQHVLLEEYARRLIAEEEMHVGEINKMLRKPGDIESFKIA